MEFAVVVAAAKDVGVELAVLMRIIGVHVAWGKMSGLMFYLPAVAMPEIYGVSVAAVFSG